MEKDYGAVATEVLKLLKKEYNKTIKRLYILLIVLLILFIISIADSIYQRCRIIDFINEHNNHCIQKVEEIKKG